MLHLMIMTLLLLVSNVYGQMNTSAAMGSSPIFESDAASNDEDIDDDDNDEYGEVDEDIIIEDEVNTNDDEGVTN
jgi:hypothetical protein